MLSAKQTCEMCKDKLYLQSDVPFKDFNLRFSKDMHMIEDSETT